MVDLMTDGEIEDLLSGENNGCGRTPLHKDYDVSELVCMFTLNYFRRRPNPPSRMVYTILEVAGFCGPCNLQQILINALKPFNEEYANTQYSDLFGENFNIYSIEQVFKNREMKLIKAASAAIVEALQLQFRKDLMQNDVLRTGIHQYLQDIAELFDLKAEEREIITFCAIKQAYTNFIRIESDLKENGDREYLAAPDGFEDTIYFADFFSFDKETFRRFTGPDSKLARLGIISNDMFLDINLYNYIFENDYKPLRHRFFREQNTACKPFSNLGISNDELETIKAIIETRSPGQNINIVVESTLQNNERECVIQLAENMGYRLIEIAEPEDDYEDTYKTLFRTKAIWAAQNHAAANEKVALIIDNADLLVNANESARDEYYNCKIGSKRRIDIMTELLNHAGVVQFWLTRTLAAIDPYIRHHFDYAIQPLLEGFGERLNFWKQTVEKYNLVDVISLDDIKKFSSRFLLDAGLIDKALRNSANLLKHGWKKRRICRHIEELLAGTSKMDTVSSCVKSELPDKAKFVSPEHLNIEPAADFQLLLDALKHSQQQLRPEGFKIAILISGMPGTGKTCLARYIADVLNRQLILKTAGSVLDKYVGETEKIIKQAFNEAQKAAAVLFFDEIDSLLTTREKATQHWQISQINEVLAGLDNFRGVFIAATNFETVLDKASLRRFDFHFHLGSLNPQGNAIFYKSLLAPFAQGKMTRAEAKQLSEIIDLTPSDFGSLRQRLQLLPDVKKSHAELMQGLIDRRNLRLGKKPAEAPKLDDGQYLLQAQRVGE